MTARLVLSALLAFFLAIASVGMAVARTHAIGMSQITICSGYGIVTVSVDAQGEPGGPPHLCPDCLSGCSLAVLPLPPVVRLPDLRVSRSVVWDWRCWQGLSLVRAQARGPPARV